MSTLSSSTKSISDIHEQWHNIVIPDCGILISSGDYSYQGKPNVIRDFHAWLDEQPAKHIISVQGNHELWVEKNFESAKAIAQKECPDIHFLQHEAIEIEGIKIFGSAYTPYFCDWAWNAAITDSEAVLYRKPLIKQLWKQIPEDTQLLITHGGPYQILDYAPMCGNVGCPHLYERILDLPKLKAHFFGHIHYSHGYKRFNGIDYFNASICNEAYNPNNPVTVYDYEILD